jgi:hypothetical protein
MYFGCLGVATQCRWEATRNPIANMNSNRASTLRVTLVRSPRVCAPESSATAALLTERSVNLQRGKLNRGTLATACSTTMLVHRVIDIHCGFAYGDAPSQGGGLQGEWIWATTCMSDAPSSIACAVWAIGYVIWIGEMQLNCKMNHKVRFHEFKSKTKCTIHFWFPTCRHEQQNVLAKLRWGFMFEHYKSNHRYKVHRMFQFPEATW